MSADHPTEDIIVGYGNPTSIEWGSRDPAGGGVFVFRSLGEESARYVVSVRNQHGFSTALVRRTVTYGPWEEARP